MQADWSQTDPVQLDYIKNKPTTFPPEAHRHDVTDINNVATVAKTGSYNDLVHTPVIPPAQVNADWNATSGVAMILNKPFVIGEQVNSDWTAISGVAQILNKPNAFPPEDHTHSQSEVEGLVDALAGKAPLDSPALSGIPTAPDVGTEPPSFSQIATVNYVRMVRVIR